ncbi:SAM-dependent methyltransferase [Limnobacter sp.]|uniref:SAM-dependent methyltransferase n=1 Tax=Limnobacter sp. TaxID=2003368 RepID=UPI003516C664
MLILVPSPLSQIGPCLPVLQQDLPLVQSCRTWVVENAKPARAALGLINMPVPIRELELHEMAQVQAPEMFALLGRAAAGEPIALMSDAGCPGVADPGAQWVRKAHELGCPVHPLVGPSSLLLALMASGMNGQQFKFNGYPPVDAAARDAWIRNSEKESRQQNCTQLAIETPFRNDRLLDALCKVLHPSTLLCLAWDLTGPGQTIKSQTVAQWRKKPEAPGKQPCLFLWLAAD